MGLTTRVITDLAAEDCNGWVLLYRGRSYLSGLIKRATGSPYSHAAILVQDGDRLDVAEVREWIGGRRQPLASQLKRHAIDVFRPIDAAVEYWDRQDTVDTILEMTGTRYGYGSILRLALRKTPLLWRLARVSDDEALPYIDAKNIRPTCSQAVHLALEDGGIRPIRKASWLVTPGDLGHSPILEPWGRLPCPKRFV